MNGQDTSAAHSAFQFIIAKAMLEGKIGKTTLQIPMTDLMTNYEGPAFHPEATSLVLQLEITSSWTEGSQDGDFEVDMEGDIGLDDLIDQNEDEEDEDDGGNRGTEQ